METKMMQALLLEEYGKQFRLAEIPRPAVGAREVLVKNRASGVNPLDTKIRAGAAAHAEVKLPAILGLDLAGVVEEVGPGVENFAPGDEVFGVTGGVGGVPGTLAEYAAVDADLLALKPDNLSMREAAALPLIFITAWEGLVDRAAAGDGKTVLIHGGGGGVGHIAVQLAKAKGARVFTTVRAEDFSLIENYGAVPIDYTKGSVEEYAGEYTNGEGFDIILDTLGGQILDASFKAAKRYTGHVVSILGWGTHSLAPLSFRSATYSGVFTLYPLISGQGRAHQGQIMREATVLVEAGKLRPRVDDAHYTFETIDDAYRAVEQGTAKGKVVVDISE